MAKAYSDFSSLKSLKKELEAKETSDAPVVNQPQKRSSTVSHPSREESQARNIGITEGAKVRMMDSPEAGVIAGFGKDYYEIETTEGYVIKARLNEFVLVDEADDKALYRAMPSSPKKVQKPQASVSPNSEDLVVDLHFDRIPGNEFVAEWASLEFQMDYFRRILRQNLKYKGKRIIFIHGDGDGVLKNALRKELDEVFAISCTYAPAPADLYGTGATAVVVR